MKDVLIHIAIGIPTLAVVILLVAVIAHNPILALIIPVLAVAYILGSMVLYLLE